MRKLFSLCINILNVVDLFLVIESGLALKGACECLKREKESKKLVEIENKLKAFLAKIDAKLKARIALKPKELTYEMDYGLLVELNNIEYEIQNLKFKFDGKVFSFRELKLKSTIQVSDEGVKTPFVENLMFLSLVSKENIVLEGFKLGEIVSESKWLKSNPETAKKIEEKFSTAIGESKRFEKLLDVCESLRHVDKMIKFSIDEILNVLSALKQEKIIFAICSYLLILIFLVIYVDVIFNQGKNIGNMMKSLNFSMSHALK